MRECFLNDAFSTAWRGTDPFAAIAAVEGEVFRRVKNRTTFRFVLQNNAYFAKIHRGVGWLEIFKNLLQLKLPVLSAANEYHALLRLSELGVDTMTPCAYGVRGWNPARLSSFLVTAELTGAVSLEDYCRDWRKRPPPLREKTALIRRLGTMTGTMHRNGVNHRDCYLCHFLLSSPAAAVAGSPRLHVIDLHRAQLRVRTPYRYAVKDVAGIWFSAMDTGVTRNDRLRFIRAYTGKPLRDGCLRGRGFWRDVDRSARRLYVKIHGEPPRC